MPFFVAYICLLVVFSLVWAVTNKVMVSQLSIHMNGLLPLTREGVCVCVFYNIFSRSVALFLSVAYFNT